MTTATRKPRRPKLNSSATLVRKQPPDRATAYAHAVVAGEIIVGRLVRMACERHLRDLETGHERGLKWDVEKSEYAIEFFAVVLKLNGGEHEGKPFALEPWQC